MGMVRQWQELTYSSRYSESYSDSLPDFVKLAEAYGWTGIRIQGPQELEEGIRQMIETEGPVLVDCHVAKLYNCFPMITSGVAHTDMLLGVWQRVVTGQRGSFRVDPEGRRNSK